ncbi:MAG TPA: SMC family ATPase, partial [Actinobacteria bacterium]|nr:SMC family ATPase [Actinomycetota bacterium]
MSHSDTCIACNPSLHPRPSGTRDHRCSSTSVRETTRRACSSSTPNRDSPQRSARFPSPPEGDSSNSPARWKNSKPGPVRQSSPTRTSRSSCTNPHGPGSAMSSESCSPTPSMCCWPRRETSARRVVTCASAVHLANCSSSISNASTPPMTTSSRSSTRCWETQMRPERLELSGFTAFREATEIDFTGADLFALTGPTGSGKSSIIDAIVFALYGSVPRYGDRRTVEPVITLGKVEARIRFDFTIGDVRYTAVRVVRRLKRGATTAEARLERDGTVVASGADEVTDAVQGLLGLSYDHFVKSVVLPQGRFAAFLHDKPTDRQKLLRELLDLGVYERVRERARDRKIATRQKATMLEARIAELAGAT